MNNDDIMGFQVDMTDEEVHTLLYAVQEALKAWPGHPARPIEEQERLQGLRDTLFRMTLEISLEL